MFEDLYEKIESIHAIYFYFSVRKITNCMHFPSFIYNIINDFYFLEFIYNDAPNIY
jgi:hypothetical protein